MVDHFRKQRKQRKVIFVDPSDLDHIELPEDEHDVSWERQELFKKAVELMRQ